MATIPDFFGLNLGHYSIKIAETRKIGDRRGKLDAIGSTPTSIGILENDSENGVKILAEEINKALRDGNVRTRNCVMSVPESSVFSRLITLPKVTDAEASEAIQYALKPLVPLPLEEVNISFLEIDEKSVEGNTFTNWYVVAAPKQLIKRFQTVMEAAGVNLFAVETEALAITRMIVYNYPDYMNKDIMVLDLGAESTNVILSRNGVVMFSQTISTGSNSVTKVISSDFGIDMVQAEKYKISFGIDFQNGEGKIAKSIEPIIQIILGEVQRTMTYYREKIGGVNLASIFITGGGADLPKLDTYLAEKLGIAVILSNPLKNLEAESGLQNSLQTIHLSGFNVALGLSLKAVL